MGIFQGMWLQP